MSNIAFLHFEEQSHKADVSEKERFYNRRAIFALEKQVPKLVMHEKTFWHYSHYCPSCISLLEKEGINYCPSCGQRLDWSNYWEALKRAK